METAVTSRNGSAYSEALGEPAMNMGMMEIPAFLMCPPFSFSTKVANNIWMEEIEPEERAVDHRRATKQFLELYHYLTSEAIVQILPTPNGCGLQDLVFVANMGVVLEHIKEKNTVIISNFKADVRCGESDVGIRFFQSMGYDVYIPPYHFEGEAELKYLYDNIYIGGYGIRSDARAHRWLEDRFDMRVIQLQEVDEYLYHLDCTVFPITKEQTIVCTEMYTKEEIRAIEEVTSIIDVSEDDCYSGITNSVRLHNILLNASNINYLKKGTELYQLELQKNRRLEDIATELGFEVYYFNLDEFMKSGALLSCLVMHLNRNSYNIDLL